MTDFRRASFLTLVLQLVMLLAVVLPAGEAVGGPLGNENTDTLSHSAYPYHRPALTALIRAYQGLISPAKVGSCPMEPHCSAYGLEAFSRYDPFRALMFTSDRIMRCGHDLEDYGWFSDNGFTWYADPVGSSGSIVAVTFAERKKTGSGAGPVSAKESETVEAADSQLFRFARELQTGGDYTRAITEYRRLLSYYPESVLGAAAAESLLSCYFATGEFEARANLAREELRLSPSRIDGVTLRLALAGSYLRLGDIDLCLDYLSDIRRTEQGAERERALMAQGLVHARLFNWTEATRNFGAIDSSSSLANYARRNEALCQQAREVPRRSPTLAGMLAVVPGLGYLYTGYEHTAVSAFLVNGLFAWAAYENFDSDRDALGAVIALFGAGWYSGNIYGSVVSAKRRNYRLQHNAVTRIELGFRF